MPRSPALPRPGSRAICCRSLDPAEEDLPFDGRVRFDGVEERDEVVISRVETVREDYAERFQRHREGLAAIAAARSAGASATAPHRPPRTGAAGALRRSLSP